MFFLSAKNKSNMEDTQMIFTRYYPESWSICPATPYEIAPTTKARDLSGHISWLPGWEPWVVGPHQRRRQMLAVDIRRIWRIGPSRRGILKWTTSELDQEMNELEIGWKFVVKRGEIAVQWNHLVVHGVWGIMLLPSYVGIMINRYKDASQTTSINGK